MAGVVFCKHGHLHASAESARVCEVAWRVTMRKRLGVDKLMADLREVLARAAARRK